MGVNMGSPDRQSSCAAETLYGIRNITVHGKSVGIARLCDAVAEVQALGLTREDEIKRALVECVSRHNYIPDKLRAEYADALLAEYCASQCQPGR
jgi:hypothetical protein